MKYFLIGFASAMVFPFLCVLGTVLKNAFIVSFDQVRGD